MSDELEIEGIKTPTDFMVEIEKLVIDKKVNYNYYVEYHSINYALCEQLIYIYQHQPFDKIKDKLVSYFLKYSEKLLARLDKLIETNQMNLVICNYVNINDRLKLKFNGFIHKLLN